MSFHKVPNTARVPTVDAYTLRHTRTFLFSSPAESQHRAGRVAGSLSVDLAVLIDLPSHSLLMVIVRERGEIDHRTVEWNRFSRHWQKEEKKSTWGWSNSQAGPSLPFRHDHHILVSADASPYKRVPVVPHCWIQYNLQMSSFVKSTAPKPENSPLTIANHKEKQKIVTLNEMKTGNLLHFLELLID